VAGLQLMLDFSSFVMVNNPSADSQLTIATANFTHNLWFTIFIGSDSKFQRVLVLVKK